MLLLHHLGFSEYEFSPTLTSAYNPKLRFMELTLSLLFYMGVNAGRCTVVVFGNRRLFIAVFRESLAFPGRAKFSIRKYYS